MTLSEVLLWQQLRRKQMMGLDFHRQKPIEKYIVDFFCPKLRLIIEIDGESHSGKEQKDLDRQRKLESMGFCVLRFLEYDVRTNIDGVLTAIEMWIRENRGRRKTHP